MQQQVKASADYLGSVLSIAFGFKLQWALRKQPHLSVIKVITKTENLGKMTLYVMKHRDFYQQLQAFAALIAVHEIPS